MVRTITMKFAGSCADCGASLPAGARARWTGRGRVFGLSCHAKRDADNALDAPGSPARAQRWAHEEAFANAWGLDG